MNEHKIGENFGTLGHQDFMISYKCKNCGHSWVKYETETFDGDSTTRNDK